MAKRTSSFFEVRHPFFRPLWRRVLVAGLCLVWAIFEFSSGAFFWAILFGACFVYLSWQFFVVFDPANYERGANEDEA